MKKGTFLLAALAARRCAAASPNGGPLGDFEAHVDVGSPKIAGYATYNGATQLYTLSAGGVNIWAKRDEFQFAYRRIKGDFIVQAMVEFQGKGVDPHRKAGIMARASIADFDSRLCRRRVARRRTHLAAVPQGQGRGHGANRNARRQGRDHHPARTPRQPVHLLGGTPGRTLRGRGNQGRRRSFPRKPTWACSSPRTTRT